MTTYYVDDGGSATAPYDTWAKAATSLSALDDAVTFASGDIVYVGHDHVCQFTHSGSRTITGPTSGLPTQIISATQGSDPVAYQKATADQVDTSEGAYSITFDGSFALVGIQVKSGDNINFGADNDEINIARHCVFKPASNRAVGLPASGGARCVLHDCEVSCIADTSGAKTSAIVTGGGGADIRNLTISNAQYRSGAIFGSLRGTEVSGVDATACTYATGVYIVAAGTNAETRAAISNVKTASTWGAATGTFEPGANVLIVNAGTADAPEYLYHITGQGQLKSSTSVWRTNGAGVEDITNVSWQLQSTVATCSELNPYRSPWIYGRLSSTGSKTFSVAVASDSGGTGTGGAFTDAEMWLEVEYLGTANSPLCTMASDTRASVTATAADQPTDGTSSWTGDTFTNLQTLAVTATVGEEGLYRARVAIGVASLSTSNNVYIDPKITVS
jgi:hypothetical protein